jgi:hypothetical protein
MKECRIRGVKHDGQPAGEIKEVGGTKSYVAKPSNPTDVGIVYLSDVFGLALVNTQLYAPLIQFVTLAQNKKVINS